MSHAIDQLAAMVRDRRAILFVGAGVSMSVGLPSWQTLIEHMSAELGLNGEAVQEFDTTYQTLAEYYRLKQGSIGPLRSWMDRNWRVAPDQVAKSRLHQLIVALDFPIIYTTNYDRNLEVAYEASQRSFVKIANARDIARASDGVTQIIKFHGDFDDDNSLVLAETDYFNRLSFNSPLDVKLRADALGRTVLFIGYSMSDINIRLLLHRIWETWAQSDYEKDRPRSYVFMSRPNPIQEAVLGRWGIDLLTEDSPDPEEALCSFLSELLQRVRDGNAC